MRLYRPLAMSALLVAAVGAGSGCTDRFCTDIGVPYGLVLSIDNGPSAASYQLQFTAEDQQMIVDYTIDDEGRATCFEGCSDRADPLSIRPEGGFGYPLLYPPNDALRLNVRRMTDPVWGPDAFHLRVFRDQVMVHDQNYTPQYQVSEPWGEGCGEDVLSTIDVDLTTPAP